MESDLLLQFITESYPIPESEAEEVNKEIPSWNQNPHSGCDPSFVEWNHISGWQPYWLLEGWTGGSFNFTIDKLPTFTVSRCTTTAQLGRLLSARFLWASCTQIFRRPTTVNDQSHRWYPALDAFFFYDRRSWMNPRCQCKPNIAMQRRMVSYRRNVTWPFVFGLWSVELSAVKDPIKTGVLLWPCDVQDL